MIILSIAGSNNVRLLLILLILIIILAAFLCWNRRS